MYICSFASLEVVDDLAKRHLDLDITTEDFTQTSAERAGRWIHQPMIAALDLLNAYEARRMAIGCNGIVKMRRKYKTDSRTRACEVIKKYIHSRMMVETLEERELRNYKEFCHAIIQRADLFPPKNTCSFVQTMAEVYQLLDALH